ncbi:DUF7558 family protein [Halobacterium hubeiense]
MRTARPARRCRPPLAHGSLLAGRRLPTPCNPGGLATYWTRELEAHLVATPAE